MLADLATEHPQTFKRYWFMHRFVTSLTRFTNLHTPASMEQKSAKAFRSMLFIAEDNGNHLHVRPHDHRSAAVLGNAVAKADLKLTALQVVVTHLKLHTLCCRMCGRRCCAAYPALSC